MLDSAGDRIESFIRDMAASYIPDRRKGDAVLELYIADTKKTYRVRLGADGCDTAVPADVPFSARVETTSDTCIRMLEGRLNVLSAFMRHMVRVKGDMALIKALPRYFDMKK